MSENVGPDLRRSERKPFRKAVVLVVETEEENSRYQATTIDVSQHGARVQPGVELKAGQILQLVRPDNPEDPLRCLVVWTADVSSDAKGEAGLEFLAPPSSLQEV